MKNIVKPVLPLLAFFMVLLSFGDAAFGAEVIMNGFKFEPQNIEINAGETVKWINKATLAHTITSGDNCKKDDQFDSGYLMPEKMKPEKSTFEKKFDAPGVYKYFCKPHCEAEKMAGSVTVK